MYVSRKIIYPLFVIVFSVCFFALIFFSNFNSSLTVLDSSVVARGSDVLIKMIIHNESNHPIKGATVTVAYGKEKKEFLIGTPTPESNLLVINPDQNVTFEQAFGLSDTLLYDVYVKAPFSRSVRIPIEIKENTLRPVDVLVNMPLKMKVGQKYSVTATLRNVSENDLFEVLWEMSENGSHFSDEFIPRSTSLRIHESKNLNAPLTPIKAGPATVVFTLTIGGLKYSQSQDVVIEP